MHRVIRKAADQIRSRRQRWFSGLLFVSIGAVVIVTAPFFGDVNPAPVVAAGVAASLSGVVMMLLPWERWPPAATLVLPIWAFVLIAAAGWFVPAALVHYLPVYVIAFVAIGATVPTMTRQWVAVSVMVAAATVSFAVPATNVVPSPWPDFVLTLLVSLIAMYMLAGMADAYQHAVDHAEHVLVAAQTVNSTTMPAETMVALRHETERVFPVDFVDATLEEHPVQLFGPSPRPQFVPDTQHAAAYDHAAAIPDRARSVYVVPLADDHYRYGTMILAWTHPRYKISRRIARAAEVLASEATRVLRQQNDTERAERDAMTDPLTGLHNRRAFDLRLAHLKTGDVIAVLDLDHFKQINDRYGHPFGDQVLRSLAACISDTARDQDWSARYGGEEFVVIYTQTGTGGATNAVNRLRERWSLQDPATTFSAGIAMHTPDRTATETFAAADTALYEAKAAGRNTTVAAVEQRVVE